MGAWGADLCRGGPPLPLARAWPSPGITSDSLLQQVHRVLLQGQEPLSTPGSTTRHPAPFATVSLHTRPKRAGPGHHPYRISCLAGQGSPPGMAPEPVPAPTGGAAAARGPGRRTWGLLCPHLSLGVSWEGRDQSSRPRGRDRFTPTGGLQPGAPLRREDHGALAGRGSEKQDGEEFPPAWPLARGAKDKSQPEGGHFLQRVPPTGQPGPQEAGQGGHRPPWTEASHCRPLHGGEPRHTQDLGGGRPGPTHPLKMHGGSGEDDTHG